MSRSRPRLPMNRLIGPSPRQVGSDPDYRFTLANERTFLAWVRTAMALVAAGLAALHLIEDQLGADVLGIMLLTLAFFTAASSYRRWFKAEQAIRLNQPLPESNLIQVLAYAVSLMALVTALLFIVGGSDV